MNLVYKLLWRKVGILSATFLSGIFLFSACNKADSTLGLNALDPTDLLNANQVDTFTLETYTIVEDSVITDNPAFSLLGSYNDPQFGSFDASFYTQLRLSGINPNFGDISTITVDSIVLGLEYAGYYGKFNQQSLEVYEITESLHIDSTYYAFSSKTINNVNLVEPGYEQFTPKPTGGTVIGSDTVDTQLRIRLRNTLAQQLINEAASTGTNFASNENFLNYFKGLKIKVNNPPQASGTGGVFYFNINDPLSKMTIYYTQNSNKKRFDFLINSECADFNHVEVDNSGKPIANVIANNAAGQKEFYAQAFKTRAVVKMKGVKNLPNNIVIHKAQILLPIQYQMGATYGIPNELSASIRINNQLSGIGVFGIYDPSYKRYTIDARNYIQALIKGEIETDELLVSPRYFITGAERVIFNGQQTINKSKPKLIVTYTEF